MAGGEGDAALPLLEEKPRQVYVDGCPGCAMDRRKAENPGIPYGLFFHTWIINLVTCTCNHELCLFCSISALLLLCTTVYCVSAGLCLFGSL
jgi:hypothetical protein